ncbi:MAG: hypothetical protein ACC657_07810 [Thiohalomonadales bacterium]
MKNSIIIFVLLLLISCGGGIENKPLSTLVNCINNNSSSPAVAQDSIRLEITAKVIPNDVPKEGVVVQLDNNGVCVKSNSAGIVTFNAISNGEHDVHVFSPPGFQWQSIYSIQPGKIQRVRLSETVSKQKSVSRESYISFSSDISWQSIYQRPNSAGYQVISGSYRDMDALS